MLMDQQTKRHRGFGFVTFESEEVVVRILFNPLQSSSILCNPFQSLLLRSSMDPAPIPDLDPCRGRPILIRIDLFNPFQSPLHRSSMDPAPIPDLDPCRGRPILIRIDVPGQSPCPVLIRIVWVRM